VALAVCLSLAVIAVPMDSHGLSGSRVFIDPEVIHVVEGDTFTVTVSIDPVVPFAGMQCSLFFDPDSLEAVSSSFNGIFGELPVYEGEGVIDNVNGSITGIFSVVTSPGFEGVLSKGAFFQAEFHVKYAFPCCPSSIRLGDVILAGSHADEIPVSVSDGTVYSSYMHFPRWDINSDSSVGLLDLSALASDWGRTGEPGWIRSDINSDGSVGIHDLSILASHWGE